MLRWTKNILRWTKNIFYDGPRIFFQCLKKYFLGKVLAGSRGYGATLRMDYDGSGRQAATKVPQLWSPLFIAESIFIGKGQQPAKAAITYIGTELESRD